jgi:hypothetical protein
MPLAAYLRLLSAGAFAATVVVVLGANGYLSPDAFEQAYAPFAWCCFKLPYFVIEHEYWIEVFALGRLVAGVIVRPEAD